MSNLVRVLRPSGLIDTANGTILRQGVIELLDSGASIVLVNFQDVTFMDSSGIGALAAALQRARAQNARLCLCSLNEQLKIILELTRLDQVFEIFSDQAAFEATIAPAH